MKSCSSQTWAHQLRRRRVCGKEGRNSGDTSTLRVPFSQALGSGGVLIAAESKTALDSDTSLGELPAPRRLPPGGSYEETSTSCAGCQPGEGASK